MKRYFGLILSSILLLGTPAFAAYEDFSRQLETMGIDIQAIESQNNISRYEMTRLLNIVECKDCMNPAQDMISRYSENFRSAFILGEDKNFSDINFLGGIYDNASYYYCIAYAADNSYMRGYPKATSSVCGGQFCGEKSVTTAEFVQIVINILSKYIYKDLKLNWKEVSSWLSKLKSDSYEAKNFGAIDRELIDANSKTCTTTCALQNTKEVGVYLKYCMFNLSVCSMQEIGKIKKGTWPIAELNLLYSQNIVDIGQTERKNTDKPIDGKTVLETLFKLNGKIQCSFNNDYDCDGINNIADSCSSTYNPNQKDTDNDGIGDVCDDDIDGDGIKNPIGIVDDLGKIDISKWTKNTDNCLFIINTNQQDGDTDKIGDICESTEQNMGIYLSIDKLQGIAPVTTTFQAITAGPVEKILRDFGDGTQGEGNSVTHTFVLPGMYYVMATAQGKGMQAKAQTIMIIGGQKENNNALQTRASSVGGKNNVESTLSTSLFGDFDEIERLFPAEHISSKKMPNQSFKKIFKTPGANPVSSKGYKNGILVGVSYFTIGVGEDSRGSLLRSSVSNPEINQKIMFDTNTYNIKQSDIAQVNRDFGDGVKKNTATLTLEYTYDTPGKKVVIQTITLNDGEELTNMITLSVGDKTLLSSYALLMIPSKLIATIGEKITFDVRIIGTMLKTPIIQITDFNDGTIQKKTGTEKMPMTITHAYQKKGSLTPQDIVSIDQCTYLKNQASIAIQGNDICLDAKLHNTLDIYRCDLDGDDIPDICDTDIDNDSIPNLLGLINTENINCSYQTNDNLNQEILAAHYQGICSLDNAPFVYNSDQLDLNMDQVGDVQTTALISSQSGALIDTDNDGIADLYDRCPSLQETRNNVDDDDGCPEVGQDFGCEQGQISDTIVVQTTQCNQCPCQFGDFSDDLTNNDQVRAILRDKKKTIPYRFSLPWIVDF